MKGFLVLIAAILLLASTAHARIYKCTDANGGLIFTDHPCPGQNEDQDVYMNDQTTQRTQSEPEVKEATIPKDTVDIVSLKSKYLILGDKINRLKQKIEHLESARQAKISILRQKRNYAANNLAGATWEQSINTEITSVIALYKEKIDRIYIRMDSLKDKREKLKTELETAGEVIY